MFARPPFTLGLFRPLLLFRRLHRLASTLGPGPSLTLLALVYTIAEHAHSEWYLVVYRDVWRPAFPLSWRIALLALFAVPACACLRFLSLAWPYAVALLWRRGTSTSTSTSKYGGPHEGTSHGCTMLPRSVSNSMEERRPLCTRGTSGDVEWDADAQSPVQHCPHPHQAPPHLFRLVVWFAIACVSLWVALDYQHPGDVRYRPLIDEANARPRREGYANGEKMFIGAMFYNNARVIPYWSDSIVKAIHYLGADNVFVSILESRSDDRSPDLLRELDARLDALRVQRRILTQDVAIKKPEDLSGRNRIQYLAALRNRVLEPLVERGGYDRVLFSNDVFIEPESIVELVKTADGAYDMACGLDFGHFGLYDMWVVRDKLGRLASDIWPYFFDGEDYEAMRTESPVPVFSCWNGIVVFDADPVLPVHLRSNRTLSTPTVANDTSLGTARTPPIRFRASPPDECHSSESFLLPYDLRRTFDRQRILINPRVIVAYEWQFYVYFKWLMRHPVLKWWIERVYDGAWMRTAVMVVGEATRVWQWDGVDCHPWW